MRLSVKKAAYADLSRAASRKSGGAPTTWTPRTGPRCGLRSARIALRRSRASTSFTYGSAHRIPPPTMRDDKTHCSMPADVFRESKCRRSNWSPGYIAGGGAVGAGRGAPGALSTNSTSS